MYLAPPEKDGDLIIDFNKAYNPPCVFSTFTTCPVPSKENILTFQVNAGEKNYNGILDHFKNLRTFSKINANL